MKAKVPVGFARTQLDSRVTEKEWLGFVSTYARFHRWLTYHTYDSRNSEPGFPDLVLVRGADLIVAELKTERGKVTAAQQAWLDALEATGTTVYVWRPSDAAEVLKVLD